MSSETDKKIDDISNLLFKDCGPPDPDFDRNSIWSWFSKIWNKLGDVAKGVGHLVTQVVHPVPAVYDKVKHTAGGVAATTEDAVTMISGLKIESIDLVNANDVFTEIEKALDKLVKETDPHLAPTNPMVQFRKTFGAFSGPVQSLIVGVLNVFAPDWSKLPVTISKANQLVTADSETRMTAEYSAGVAATMVVLKALSSAISAAGQLWPLSIGLGVYGGVSVVAEGEAGLNIKFVRIGAALLLIKVVCDIVHELLNVFVKTRPTA